MKNCIRILAILGCLVTPCLASDAFKNISFEEALKLAEKENKPVFIDFYTNWCGWCTRMDQTVFKEEKVVTYFENTLIAIKVNGDKNRKVADRYRVNSYPTYVIVNAKGDELGRITGASLVSRLFLEEIEGIQSGKDAFTLATEQLEKQGGESNFDAMLEFGMKTTKMGKYVEASNTLSWCYEKATAPDSLYADSLEQITMCFRALAKKYPNTKNDYTRLKNQATVNFEKLEKELKSASTPEEIKAIQSRFGIAAKAYLGFQCAEGNSDEAVKRFETYRNNNEKDLARAIFPVIFPALLQEKKYALIQDYIDIPEAAKKCIDQCKQKINALPRDKKKEMKVTYQCDTVDMVSGYYEALLALDRGKEARQIASKLSRLYRSAYTYNALAWKGYRSGKPDKATLQQAKKAYKMANEDDISIFDTLIRVTAAVEGKEEACECFRKKYQKYMGKENATATIYQLRGEYGC